MKDHQVLGLKPRRKLSLVGRILEAVRVGLCMLALCACAILGISLLAWVILLALDPRHQALEAISAVLRLVRVPMGVACGLSVFFTAVTWDSARMRNDSFETLADRRAPARSRQPLREKPEVL
jgi:hypothetical protein